MKLTRSVIDKAQRCCWCASVLEGKEGVSGAATADGNPEEPSGSKCQCFHECCLLERMNSDVVRNNAWRSCIGMESSSAWINIIM